jgi:hypothetical protein
MLRVGQEVTIHTERSLRFGGKKGVVVGIDLGSKSPIKVKLNENDTIYHFSENELIFDNVSNTRVDNEEDY